MKRGMLTIVSGFSGAGKSSVTKGLVADYPGYWLSVSCTTRDPREGEQEGREYYFKTKPDFEKLIGEDSFLEFAEYTGNYYGTPKQYVEEHLARGINVILEIEVQGAMKVKTKIPEAVLVFVVAPSMETLIRRLRDRKTETEEKIQSRIRQMKTEFTYIPKYDYLLVNDDLDDAVRRLDEIIRTNASHVAENGEMLKDIENYLGGLS